MFRPRLIAAIGASLAVVLFGALLQPYYESWVAKRSPAAEQSAEPTSP